MSKLDLAAISKGLRATLSEHGPEILTGIGIAGMVATVIMAVRATPKAIMLVNEKECEQHVEKLPKKEVFKTCWKCYIPTAITGASSIACLIGASSVNARRNAALATAYTISETALREYKEKVIETVGEKKEQTIREKVSEERVKQIPANTEIYVTGRGETLFLDPLSKRTFKSDVEFVRRAVNNVNERMLNDICGYASLNEFYDEIEIERTDVGNDIGWNTDNILKIDFHPSMTQDMKPCLALYYDVPPKWGYDKFM